MDDKQSASDPIRRIVTTRQAPIGWLTIDNVARYNAMSMNMWGELERGIAELAADDSVRVIIVTGQGSKAFCAGGDISEFATLRSAENAATGYDAIGSAAMAALNACPKPTIAMIEGYCLGGGLGIALQCDLRIAATDARLGIPAAKRGIAYSYAGVKQLVDLVGPSRTKKILFTARQFDSDQALAMGLLDEIVTPATLRQTVLNLAHEIADNAPLSVRAAKLMVAMATTEPAERDLSLCDAARAECLASEDYREASLSFIEKRRPNFTGR